MFNWYSNSYPRKAIANTAIKNILSISKGNGSFRKIVIPTPEFNTVLKKFNTKLNIITHYYINKYQLNDTIQGFISKKNSQTNALKHLNYQYTLNMDLKDFFGTVTFDMVSTYFIKEKNEHILNRNKIKKILKNKIQDITTYAVNQYIEDGCGITQTRLKTFFFEKTLPQGFCTSPNLANIAFIKTDLLIKEELLNIEKEIGSKIEYTRYADDLTFSFNDFKIKDILLKKIENIILKQGFNLNSKKIKFMDSKKEDRHITGIRIKDGQTLPTRKTKRKLRAAIHQNNIASKIGLKNWCDITLKNENDFKQNKFNFNIEYQKLITNAEYILKYSKLIIGNKK